MIAVTQYSQQIRKYLHWRYGLDQKGTIPAILAEPGDRRGEAQAPRAGSSGNKQHSYNYGLPHVSGAHDKIGDMAILIAEQRDLIDLKVRQSVIEYNRLTGT